MIWNAKKGTVPIMLAILLTVFSIGCGKGKDKTEYTPNVLIEASTAFFPMTETIMGQIFESSDTARQIVTPVATSEGFADISSGTADMLISSIPNEQQQKLLDDADGDYACIPVITEPLVILVNENNPVDSVSMEQLRNLYQKNDQNWSEYGGNDLPVTTYQLAEGNGSQTVFSQYVKGMQVGENHREIQTMNAIIDAVAEDESGICYAFSSYYFRGYSGMNTKAVQIEGKDFDDSGYPLTCVVSAYYCKDNRNPDLKRIIDFLQSEEGRKVVEGQSL